MSASELELLEAVDLVNSGKVIIIDVLVPEHFERRHIAGAKNACVYEVGFQDAVRAIVPDSETPLLFYGAGQDSRDSRVAVEKMEREGYSEVYCFPGGLEEWRAEGYRLEGSAVDEVDPPNPELVIEGCDYELSVTESLLRWEGRNVNGSHYGTIPMKSGFLDARNMIGEMVLDMAGLKDMSLDGDDLQPVLEAHLRSDDFFFTTMFPEATFRMTAMQPVPDCPATLPNFRMMGQLKMRGASKDVFAAVQLRNVADGKLTMQGNLDFDRTEWGVIYGSSRFFQHLGYHVVYDLVSVDFRLVFEPK